MTSILKLDEHISSLELFSQVEIKPRVKDNHTFGSPVYVLDERLQRGESKPKWQHKARIGMYLGPSPRHSKMVALVLNLETGHVSPQFHCQFDDMCYTLRPLAGSAMPQSKWQDKAGFVVGKTTPRPARQAPDQEVGYYRPGYQITRDSSDKQADDDISEHDSIQSQQPSLDGHDVSASASSPTTGASCHHDQIRAHSEKAYTVQDNMEDPIAFPASNNPDIMYLNEAMAAPDKEEFRKAMLKEVESHQLNQHWELVKRADLPAGTEVLPAVWAFCRKSSIATQKVYKWKAQLNSNYSSTVAIRAYFSGTRLQ
jgi:hypothetical protein